MKRDFFVPYRLEGDTRVPLGIEESLENIDRYKTVGVSGVLIGREYVSDTGSKRLPSDTRLRDLPWESYNNSVSVRAYNGLANTFVRENFRDWSKATIQDVVDLVEMLDARQGRQRRIQPKNFGKKSYELLHRIFEDAGYPLPHTNTTANGKWRP